MTVSSPCNIGMNLSPRIISDWFSGRNRHNTFILHSALASAIVGKKMNEDVKEDEFIFEKTANKIFPVQPFPVNHLDAG